MTHSIRSSSTSAPCRPPTEALGGRLDWRPSRWVIAALGAIGLLGALAIFGSDMPRLLAWPLALAAAGHAAWSARRESRRPHCQLVWPMDAEPMIDGQILQHAQLRWRGPLAFLRWRDDAGRRHHLAWWPDTLPPRARRELRLAAASCASTHPRASMAP